VALFCSALYTKSPKKRVRMFCPEPNVNVLTLAACG
jgi:hypothetical protein